MHGITHFAWLVGEREHALLNAEELLPSAVLPPFKSIDPNQRIIPILIQSRCLYALQALRKFTLDVSGKALAPA